MQQQRFAPIFGNAAMAFLQFNSEASVRQGAAALRLHSYDILAKRSLHLSLTGHQFHAELNKGKFRKDGITPNEQHEQIHVMVLDALLKASRSTFSIPGIGKDILGWDEDKYGDEDALFLATLLHDVIEDHDMTRGDLIRYLDDAIEAAHANGVILRRQRDKLYVTAEHAVNIVQILTRDAPIAGSTTKPSRSEYTTHLLSHPAAVLIKYIDWTDKLATMIGVPSFEKDGQRKMKINLDETEEFFGDYRLALRSKATALYPGIGEKVKKLDAIMSIVLPMVQGYSYRCSNPDRFTQDQDTPYDFTSAIPLANSVLKFLPNGIDRVHTTYCRIVEAGKTNPVIASYAQNSLNPALRPLYTSGPFSTPAFSKASACFQPNFAPKFQGPTMP